MIHTRAYILIFVSRLPYQISDSRSNQGVGPSATDFYLLTYRIPITRVGERGAHTNQVVLDKVGCPFLQTFQAAVGQSQQRSLSATQGDRTKSHQGIGKFKKFASKCTKLLCFIPSFCVSPMPPSQKGTFSQGPIEMGCPEPPIGCSNCKRHRRLDRHPQHYLTNYPYGESTMGTAFPWSASTVGNYAYEPSSFLQGSALPTCSAPPNVAAPPGFQSQHSGHLDYLPSTHPSLSTTHAAVKRLPSTWGSTYIPEHHDAPITIASPVELPTDHNFAAPELHSEPHTRDTSISLGQAPSGITWFADSSPAHSPTSPATSADPGWNTSHIEPRSPDSATGMSVRGIECAHITTLRSPKSDLPPISFNEFTGMIHIANELEDPGVYPVIEATTPQRQGSQRSRGTLVEELSRYQNPCHRDGWISSVFQSPELAPQTVPSQRPVPHAVAVPANVSEPRSLVRRKTGVTGIRRSKRSPGLHATGVPRKHLRTPISNQVPSAKKVEMIESHTSLEHTGVLGCSCGTTFSNTQNLKRHIKSIGKIFECTGCGRQTSRSDNLNTHQLRCHSYQRMAKQQNGMGWQSYA